MKASSACKPVAKFKHWNFNSTVIKSAAFDANCRKLTQKFLTSFYCQSGYMTIPPSQKNEA